MLSLLLWVSTAAAEQQVELPASLPHSDVNRTFTQNQQQARSYKTKLTYASALKALEAHLGKEWKRQKKDLSGQDLANIQPGIQIKGADRYLNPSHPDLMVTIIMIQHQVPSAVALEYPYMVTVSVGPAPETDPPETD